MAKYEVGETVVVMDGTNHYYEAKILKAENFSNQWKYYIHYQGWKRKWDCWISEGLAFKRDKEGEELLKLSKQNRKGIKSVVSSASASNTSGNHNKKRSHDENPDEKRRKKQMFLADMTYESKDMTSVLKLQIPLTLKKHMVDEWKVITQPPFRILSLPRSFTVTAVINEFMMYKKSKVDDRIFSKYDELFKGLKAYFDKALPLVLLYRQERSQFADFACLDGNIKFLPSNVYGIEHLLRLFVRIPHFSSEAIIAPSDLTFVHQKLVEFLKFLQKNSAKFLDKLAYKIVQEDSTGNPSVDCTLSP